MRNTVVNQLITFILICFAGVVTSPVYAVLRDNDTTLNNAQTRLTAAIKSNNWVTAGRASYELSTINYDRFKIDEAIQYSTSGIEFSNRGKDILFEAKNLYGLGSCYYAKFNYSAAMENLLKALKLTGKLNDRVLLLFINNRIGMIYKYLEDYDKAMLYLAPAYQEAVKLRTGPLGDLLINIGNVKHSQGAYTESIGYYEKYLALQPNDRFKQVIAYNNIAKSYLEMKETDRALALFTKAYEVEDTVVNARGRAYSYNNFGTVAYAKGNYKKAIFYETQSLKQAQYYGIKSLIWTCYNILAECYQKTGEYELANLYLNKYQNLKDSIFARRRIDRISVLDVSYRVEAETEQNKHQIITLQKENDFKKLQLANLADRNRINTLSLLNLNKEKSLTLLKLHNLSQNDSLNRLKLDNFQKANQVTTMKLQGLNQLNELKSLELSIQRRNTLLVIVATGILLFVLFVYYRRYRFKKLLEVENLRLDIAADFHDELGSTLSSIALYSEMALRDNLTDTHRTKGILSIIGESSRGMVSAMQDMIWSIQPKNDNMNEVIYRMREYAIPLAEIKNIYLNLDIDETIKNTVLSMDTRKNIYLVFKEGLNNAFKYASAQNIAISLTRNNNTLNMCIIDDGIGFDIAASTQRQGNGLHNMRKRAGLVGGVVNITSELGTGTQILFSCPVG